MELYAEVRRSVYVEGLSERAAARRFGLARETVRKMLRYPARWAWELADKLLIKRDGQSQRLGRHSNQMSVAIGSGLA